MNLIPLLLIVVYDPRYEQLPLGQLIFYKTHQDTIDETNDETALEQIDHYHELIEYN